MNTEKKIFDLRASISIMVLTKNTHPVQNGTHQKLDVEIHNLENELSKFKLEYPEYFI